MEFIADNMETILLVIGQITAAVVAIVSLIKALRSEVRAKAEVGALKSDVAITRAGIVQAFKEAVVTKDVKVSINKQVEQVLDKKLAVFTEIVKKSEERRTKMVYWSLRIMSWTAAANKLTTEQKTELDELMALIAEEEQIVDTL